MPLTKGTKLGSYEILSPLAKQFLMNTVSDQATSPITVILNWRGFAR